jgi:hypothetical protein
MLFFAFVLACFTVISCPTKTVLMLFGLTITLCLDTSYGQAQTTPHRILHGIQNMLVHNRRDTMLIAHRLTVVTLGVWLIHTFKINKV